MIGQQASPTGVGQDHEFGDDAIERGIAATLHDSDRFTAIRFAIDIEREINAVAWLGLAADLVAFRAQSQREPPQGAQRKGLRQVGWGRVFGYLVEQSLGHHAFEMIMTQIFDDPDPVDP